MKIKGIRIYVRGNGPEDILFPDIFEEIQNGESLKWSILFLDGWKRTEEGKSHVFDKEADSLAKGLFLTWEALKARTADLIDLEEVYIIGCKDEALLRRYETDQEMFETCDITIILIDCAYWEVFSKDTDLISRFAIKFKVIELIESDY